MRFSLSFILTCVAFLASQHVLIGQNVVAPIEAQFELFNNKNGLSQGFVSDIIQDKTGFLWFATKDGLNKFDGYHISVYRYNPEEAYSLPDNSIAHVTEDEQGNFWVGTRNKGLFLFDRLRERFYPIERDPSDNLVNNPITSLIGKDHKLLVADYHDICIYDISQIAPSYSYETIPKKIRKLFSFNNLQNPGQQKSDNRLLANVTWMPDNSIWKATPDTVFICKPDATLTNWQLERKPMSAFGMGRQRVFAVFPGIEPQQIVLIGSSSLTLFDTKKQQVVFQQKLNDAGEPLIDYFGKEPFMFEQHKVMYYDRDGFHVFDLHSLASTSYRNNDLTSKAGFKGLIHYVDRDGILWIGSSGYGIYKYNKRLEQFYSLPTDGSGFIEDTDHNMYFNFRTGASLLHVSDKTLKPVLPTSLWNNDWENPIVYCRTKNGMLWLQVESKKENSYLLLKYDINKQSIEDHTDILYKDPDGQLLAVFSDSRNNLWQLCYDADHSRKFVVADAITSKITATYPLPLQKDVNKISSFLNSTLEDAKGIFWFSTNLGLFRFNPVKNEWHQFKNNPSDASSLSGDIIFSSCPDPSEPDTYLWVGTNGRGLNQMNLKTGQCRRYDEKDGLPNNVIYGIVSDEAGNLWLSTNQGLSCFNRQQGKFRNYTTEDGLPGNEFNRGQFYKSTNGLLFFGGVDGITWFDPKVVLKSILPPNNIVLTGFSIYNKKIDFKLSNSILHQPIQYTKTINLPAEKNMFTIEFALLQYASPDKKHYKYFLEGFDKDWIDNGTKNSATFTNLDPGEYVFHVIGSNSDGVWNTEGTKLHIIIKAPWYKTWWFKAFLFFFVAGSVYAFYRYRLYQSLKVISMRNIIASDLHDEIGSTISSISVYSDIIENKVQDRDLQQLAERISNSSRNILVVMSDIVWSVNPKNDRFDNVILRMKSFANEVLEVQKKKVYFEADPNLNDIKMQMNDRKNFYLIFKEALNNVVKYAHAEKIWISVTLDQDDLLFIMKDDGIGFDMTENKEGNGLLNMQRRSRDLNGTIDIKSKPGEGTEIRLRFSV